MSQLSGETSDRFIADFTVAVNAGHLEKGSDGRIENELDKSSLFAGKKVFKNAKQFLNACQTLANNHQNQCVGKIVALLQAFGLIMSF